MKYNHKFFDNPNLAFEIAKRKSVDFKNNIHDYMFMYEDTENLYFKHKLYRDYTIIRKENT